MNRAGVVHQDVERTELRDGLFKKRVTRLRVRQTSGKIESPAAGGGNRIAGRSRARIAPVTSYIRARLRQSTKYTYVSSSILACSRGGQLVQFPGSENAKLANRRPA
jgi:hypothetical protein